MGDYIIQGSTLDAIAEAINQKAGTQVAMTPAQMVTAIGSISGSAYEVYEYTQAEDWLSVVSGQYPKGTAAAVAATYLTQGDGLYYVVCTNNNASTKRFNYGLFAKWGNVGCSYTVRESTNGQAGPFDDNTRDLFITAGAKITVTFISRGDAP